jgi:hypothetical protein
MARVTRRGLLKMSGAGAVAAQTGGLAAILAAGRAPAFAQGTTLHWLRWADFVPASDALLKGQITQECQKATGITLKLETINANDLQSRITSAIQSGPEPTSSWRSETGRSSIPKAWPMSVTWPRRSARPKAATTTSPSSSPRSATNGLACRGPSSAGWSPIANRGSRRLGTTPSPKRGTAYAMQARS